MPSNARLSAYRTAIIVNANELIVRYIATDIVRANADTVTLDSGGWRTVTTKRKMVQASNQFGLGFTVSQINGTWYVTRLGRSPEGGPSANPAHGAVAIPFHDGMTFPRGTVTPEMSDADRRAILLREASNPSRHPEARQAYTEMAAKLRA